MKKILSLADLRKHKNLLANKEIFVFDLDGTLTRSKQPLDAAMARLLTGLLRENKVAVIGGGGFRQFQKQFLRRLAPSKNLFIFPMNATAFYRYNRGWKKIYEYKLSHKEKTSVLRAFTKVFRETGYQAPRQVYGPVLEDRGSQITFSALGQRAPLLSKVRWNKTQDSRPLLMRRLRKYLPQLEIRSGGLTSIDITRKGIDKEYGIGQIEKRLKVSRHQMIFVGDALYPGGNDYAAVKSGVDCLKIFGPQEVEKILALLEKQRKSKKPDNAMKPRSTALNIKFV